MTENELFLKWKATIKYNPLFQDDLMSFITGLKNKITQLESSNEQLKKKCEIMRDALGFYSKRDYYQPKNFLDHDGDYEDVDFGKKALLSLKQCIELED